MIEQMRNAGYVVIGLGDLTAEKVKEIVDRARKVKVSREEIETAVGDLGKRGSKVVTKVTRSKPAKQAMEGTKQATRQLKDAATSLRKAVGLQEEEKAKKAS
jgi:hypothetical protein